MLSEHALYERKWEDFPELAKLLDQKQLGVNWTGPTSVSDNTFDKMSCVLGIFALVQDHKSEIEQAVIEIGDPVRRDLMLLSHALKWASGIFLDASELSSRLVHHR